MVRATDDLETSSYSDKKELVRPDDPVDIEIHFVYTGEESAYKGQRSSPRQITFTLGLSIFGAVIGSALPVGYNTCVINAPMDHIKDFINNARESRYGSPFSSETLLWYWSISVSCTCLAAPLGCFLGSFLAFRLGRKDSLMVINLITIVGSLLQSFCVACESYEMFTMGRVITGIQNGAGTVICPLYLCEIAPKAIRGGVGVFFQLSVVFGCLISSVISFESLLGSADQWPQLFNFNLVFAAIQLIVLPFCPESPRFLLVEKQDQKRCEESLRRLRGGGGASARIKEEMGDIEAEHEKQMLDPAPTLKEFITVNRLRRPLILACVMALSQQLSGVNSISTFSSAIFKASLPEDKVHDNPDLTNYMIAAMWLVSCVATVCAVSLVERIGRKASHLIGLTSMAVCTVVVAFLFSDLATDDDQTCHGIHLSSWGNYVSIVFIYLYMTIFVALGPSSVPWTIGPELFTVGASGKGVSIAATTNWLANFSVQLGFQPLQNALCGWVFLIFFILLIVFIVYLYLKLPETRGMAITDIVKLFE